MKENCGIKIGWLIDGTGQSVQENVCLEIRDGRVRSIDPIKAPDPAAGPGFRSSAPDRPLLDFSRCTVLPGLVDSHVHLTLSGSTDPGRRARQLRAGCEALRPVIAENLARHLSCGVLAVRDGGDRQACTWRFLRDPGGLGPGLAPVAVQTGGSAWHKPGRYGGLIGRPVDPDLTLAQAVARHSGRCDWVKVVNSGLNSLTEFGKETPPQFEEAELREAVAAARRLGLSVMAHANGREPVRIALLAGCRSIEHGFFMGPENLERLAEREATWVPTAVTMQAYLAVPGRGGRSDETARRTLEHQIEQLRRARELQVEVAVGTDAGSPGVDHGEAVLAEMKLFMAAGFTLAETVRCATGNGARLIGSDSGILKPGMPASFLAVSGPPAGLPESLRNITAVYIAGQRVLVPAVNDAGSPSELP
jgi:imidazolonepropionase-like amidohydrolase